MSVTLASKCQIMEAPFVSIIIPTFDRPAELRQCLRCLLPQIEISDTRVELLVCDDGQSAETRTMIDAEFPTVQWHAAASRNQGAAAAKGEWLIFLDDDILPQTCLLSAYLKAFLSASESDVAFEGATLTASPPSLLWEAPFNPNCSGHPSCNWGVRRSMFFDTKGFDERYIRMQDIEFAARVEAMGYEFRPLKEAIVIHPLRRVPCAYKLAKRWEYKLLYSLEIGAHPVIALYRMPWHTLRVIQSRFRQQAWNYENLLAIALFALEWGYVLWLNPGWIKKWSKSRRSPFWEGKNGEGYHIPNYGF